MHNTNGDLAGLGVLLKALRRRWLIFALSALLVPAAAAAVALQQEKVYAASSSLLFRDAGFDEKLFGTGSLSRTVDPDREAATNLDLISLEAVAARTARRLEDGYTPTQVAQDVEPSGDANSNVVRITATAPTKRQAVEIANIFAEEFITFRREADRSKIRGALDLIKGQIDALTPDERAGDAGRSLRQRSEQLAVLSFLQTGNAELVQRARAEDAPVAPRPFRNAMLGLVLGLLLGVTLAFAADRLDRRVRDPEEFGEIFDRPLLGAVPDAARSTPQAMSIAALNPGEAEAYRMLRANLLYFNVQTEIKSVLVTSAAPGEGKTTISWNLAVAAASAGARVLIVEADLRRPRLTHYLSLDTRKRQGLSAVLANRAQLDEVVERVPVGAEVVEGHEFETPEVHLLVAGGVPPNPSDLLESDRMQALIREAELKYDLVIIDTPPTSVVSDAVPLVTKVSGVLVVGRLGRSTRVAMRRLSRQLTNLSAPVLGVVVNGVRRSEGSYGYGYEEGEPEPRGRARRRKAEKEEAV